MNPAAFSFFILHPSALILYSPNMRYTLKTIFTLCTGMWLGGMVASLLILFTLFAKDRNVAVQVGPHLITTFEKFQAVVGIIAVFSLIGWRLLACSRPKRIIMPLILLAVIGATVSSAIISPRVNDLWFSGRGGTPEFWKWHGISQLIYVVQSLCLLATLIITPWAIDAEK